MKVSVSQVQNGVIRPKSSRLGNSSPSFGKIKISAETLDIAKKAMGKFPRALFLTDKFQGELCNAWITAAGTALIAPFFIAFNPFSKEDKETKCYSAWRQPISAVLQLVTQLGINSSFNNFMDKTASTGGFKSADMRSCPADSYLETLVKLRHPNCSEQELKDYMEQERKNAFESELKRVREEFKHTSIADDKLVGRSDLEKELEALKDPIKKEIKTLKESNSNPARLQELKAQLKDEKALTEKAMQNAKKNILEEVAFNAEKKLRIRKLNDGKRTVEEAIAIAREKYNSATKGSRDGKIWEEVIQKLDDINRYERRIGSKKPFETVKNIGNTYDDILRNVKIKQYLRATGDTAKFTLKQMRLWSSIVISLMILPVSCYLLNWTYPRIMEKIMPNASKKKHHQQQPPKKEMEVK